MSGSSNDAASNKTPQLRSALSTNYLQKGESLAYSLLFSYSSIAFGVFASDILVNMYLQLFLLDWAKIPPFYTGIILSCAELVEVILSPLIGSFSDKTETKFGKRKPWILAGSITGCLSVLLLFFVIPQDLSDTSRFVYYLAMIVLNSISFPSVSIPHQALAPDLTSDYEQRFRISSWRSAFSFGGMLLMVVYAFLLFTFKLDQILENQQKDRGNFVWLVLAAFPSAVTLIIGIVSFIALPNANSEFDDETIDSTTCLKSLRVFSLPTFVIVVMIFSLIGLVQSLTLSLLPLFVVHSIGFGLDTFSQVAIVMIGSTVLTMYVLAKWIGSIFEKRTILCFGCVVGIFSYVAFFYVPGADETPSDWARYMIFPISILAGISSAITFTLPNSMMADVTDLAFLKFRAKQEGFMFSVMETLQSVFQAVGGFLINLHLDRIGYQSDGTQTELVKMNIRIMFVGIPVAAYLLVWFLGACYTINHKRHYQILKGIRLLHEEHEDEIDVVETGKFIRDSPFAPTNFDNTRTLDLKKSQFELLMRKRTMASIASTGSVSAITHTVVAKKDEVKEEKKGESNNNGDNNNEGNDNNNEKVTDDKDESSSEEEVKDDDNNNKKDDEKKENEEELKDNANAEEEEVSSTSDDSDSKNDDEEEKEEEKDEE